MNEVVRIKDGNCIILLVHRKELLKHPLERKTFALFRRMCARADNGPLSFCDLARIVRAVVGDDVDIIQFLRVVKTAQICDELANDRCLIVGGNDDGKGFLRCQDLFLSMPPQTAKTNKEEVQRKEQKKDLHRHHDDIKDMRRQIGRKCMKDLCHISFPLFLQSEQSHD